MKTTSQPSTEVTSTTIVRSKHPVSVYHCTRTAQPAAGAPARECGAHGRRPQPGGQPAGEPEFSDVHDADIVFRLYAREIGQVALLTPEEEIVLSRRIRKGDEAARELMIKANLRLVVKIARDYQSYGLPFLDLISEGNLGLMKAVGRFDPRKGAKLSTYAAFYIKQAMRRAIGDHVRLIRMPVYAQEQLVQINRTENKLRELYGRTPSSEEISAEMGLPAVKVRRLRDASLTPVSLDAPQDEDATNPVSETVADENAPAPAAGLEQEDNSRLMNELMKNLPARELQVLRHRFGFEEGRAKTLEEIGTELGLTRERIRQLQNSALRKLRVRFQAHEPGRLAA